MKKNISLVILITMAFVAGCSKSEDGFAPDTTTTAPPGSTDATSSHIKYGSEVTTASGWAVNFDHADPVEAKTTANGWRVEVKYE